MGEGKTTTTTTTTRATIKTKREHGLFTVEQKQKQQQRLKREDCHRTKHDSAFSKWQILIGSSDWEDHRLGKDGAERYRIANLPNITSSSSCPGIYELGVSHVDDGRDLRKLGPRQILVVYLGQADNVRTRLQHYGRAGSHLDHHNVDSPAGSNKNSSSSSSSSNERSGFFQDVFARGFSIVFRWSPTKSKRAAEEKEALLLQVFDYAWNKMGNGCCRRDDILLKLKRTLPPANPLDALVTNLKLLLKTRVGVDVDVDAPLQSCADVDEPSGGTTVSKFFLKSRPRSDLRTEGERVNVCGVVKADGSVCTNRPPTAGRKRCQEHKGRRIACADKPSALVNCKKHGEGRTGGATTCGVTMEDGSVCTALPPKGRKRCEAHKGRRRMPTTHQTK